MMHKPWFVIILALMVLLTACSSPVANAPSPTLSVIPASPTAIPSATSLPPAADTIWIGSSVPASLRDLALSWGLEPAPDAASASVRVDIAQPLPNALNLSTWIYALVAPFPTVVDDVTSQDLRDAWTGVSSGPYAGRPLLMDDFTLTAFTLLWGQPAPGSVRSVPAEQLSDTAWAEIPSWAIVPFESLDPRWKVLAIDGQSPVRKNFSSSGYPLIAYFRIHSALPAQYSLAPTNRDPSRLTTVILTGVTALVRATAYTMDIKGILYPGRDIRDWMLEADIAHISNEIPFYSSCASPNPNQSSLVFCSSSRYIDLLTDIGTDVVELTGNHFGDYGAQAMLETLAIYNEKGIPYYGGGRDRQDAIKPLLIEDHGNKIAFIGCNKPDTGGKPTATDQRPGAAPCEFDYMSRQIGELRDQGYVVIATFQWNESGTFSHLPFVFQYDDFRLMADSGAAIVSGSQAHAPQTMEFYNGAFIHYGLGNLFFDQMGKLIGQSEFNRWGFMDRYTIYEGRVVSVELLTTILEDYSRPRPMTPQERARFLQLYFSESGWLSFTPSPTPEPTATLTPLSLPPLVGSSSGFLPETPTP
jgi:hypothetical protein